MKPYLSIVMGIGGQYSSDLHNRLMTSTRHTIACAEMYNVSMELIIVCWNMPRVKVGWVEQLPKTDIRIRVIDTEDAHDQVPNPYGFKYFEWYPKNIGIRRAQGEFVLSTNPDDIFSPNLFSYFKQRRLEHNYYYRADRYDYRDDEIYAVCRNDGVYWPGNPLPPASGKTHFCASGDFTLMSSHDWFKIHGNPEVAYNHTVDGQTLHIANWMGLRQCILPYPIFHPDHVRTLNHAFMPSWDDERPHGIKNNQWGFPDREFPEVAVVGKNTPRLHVMPKMPALHSPKWNTWPDPKPDDIVLVKILDQKLRLKNGEYVYLHQKYANRWVEEKKVELCLTDRVRVF